MRPYSHRRNLIPNVIEIGVCQTLFYPCLAYGLFGFVKSCLGCLEIILSLFQPPVTLTESASGIINVAFSYLVNDEGSTDYLENIGLTFCSEIVTSSKKQSALTFVILKYRPIMASFSNVLVHFINTFNFFRFN